MLQNEYLAQPEEPARRPHVQSVVAAVDDHGGRAAGKRAAGGDLPEEQSDAKRRNKRLFGAILGTLQRFR